MCCCYAIFVERYIGAKHQALYLSKKCARCRVLIYQVHINCSPLFSCVFVFLCVSFSRRIHQYQVGSTAAQRERAHRATLIYETCENNGSRGSYYEYKVLLYRGTWSSFNRYDMRYPKSKGCRRRDPAKSLEEGGGGTVSTKARRVNFSR